MAIHLQFAPSADLLLEPFLHALRKLWTDPFAPPTVLVPNPALGRWLRLRLADHAEAGLGCVLSLRTNTLERYLWDALEPGEGMARLGADTLGQVLDALLDEALCAEPVFAPVRLYLLGSDGRVDALRRVQLAGRLARMFQEYEFNRPSVGEHNRKGWRLEGADAAWLRGQPYFRDAQGNEAWQSELYRRALTLLRTPSEGSTLLSLPHLHRLRREQATPWCVAPGPVLLFQLAKISHFHRNTLIEVAQMPGVDLHVFLTNPCAEFWEDVDTWRRRKSVVSRWTYADPAAGITARKPDDYQKSCLEEIGGVPQDQALLELWGQTGKENIYLWCPAAEWDFAYAGSARALSDEPPATLLEALQFSLLRRSSVLPPPVAQGPWSADGSLVILEAPDRVREVEELRCRILTLLNEKTVDKLEEIVVYLADPAAYLAPLARVFGAYGFHDGKTIPYVVLGMPGSDSLFAQGMQDLLALVAGSFDRSTVFSLLRNPLVQAGHRYTADDVAVWEHWAGALGIFRGYDKEHRLEMGDAPSYAEDAHTFGLGMARLLVGNLASGSVELGYGAPLPVYRDYESSDGHRVARFCALITMLRDQTRYPQGHDVHALVDWFVALTENWFHELPEKLGVQRAGEMRVKREFLEALRCITAQQDVAKRTSLEREEVLELIKACLPAELPAASKAWTGGVTFAPLRQGMVLPHTAIFVLGLDAATYPGANNATPFDLLGTQRLLGDSDSVRENRFTFLELLHAARKSLTLSFRARNMQKEEVLQPSSVVLELEAWLKMQGVPSLRQEIPWIAWEQDSPTAEWDGTVAALRALRSAPRYTRRYAPMVVAQPSLPADGVVRLSQAALTVFFKNPLEYHLRHVLNLVDDESPETLLATDEPLSSDSLTLAAVQKAVWTDILQAVFPAQASGQEPAWETFAQERARVRYLEQRLLGTTPEAQFAAMEMDALVQLALEYVAESLKLRGLFPDHRILLDTDLSLGQVGRAATLVRLLQGGTRVEVAVRHRLALVPRTGDGLVGLAEFSGDDQTAAADIPELWLRGALQGLCADETAIALVSLARKTGTVDVGELKHPVQHSDQWRLTGEWLDALLGEMLEQTHAEALPLPVVKKLVQPVKGQSGLKWDVLNAGRVNAEVQDDNSAYRCFLSAYQLVDAGLQGEPEEIQAIARRRFAPLLEKIIHA